MIKDESIRASTPVEPAARRSVFPGAEAKPFIVLVVVIAVLILIAEFIVAHTAPLENLFLSTKWSVVGAIHGSLGSIIFISGGIAVYLGYRLLTGQLESLHDLRTATLVTTLAALATIFFGNWIYIGYRMPGMIQDYFLEHTPELHLIFFEFKENIALFTIPLGVAATFILYRYGDELRAHSWLRTMVFILLALVFLFFLVTFGLGAAITKIKPV